MPAETISIERKLLKSKVFRSLNGTEKTVLMDFLLKRVMGKHGKKGKESYFIQNNGEIEYCYSEAVKKTPPIPAATFMRAIDKLVERGFIEVTSPGSGGKKGDKSKYAISNRWRKWGTFEFKECSRPKDKRRGRGFKPGKDHWKNKHRFQK
jgi:hypothetical protein